MSYYECKRCGHKTKQKIEMNRHLKRKKKCSRNINSYHYLESEIEKISLVKHNSNNSKDKMNYDMNHHNVNYHKIVKNEVNHENETIDDEANHENETIDDETIDDETKDIHNEAIDDENETIHDEVENIHELKKKLNLNINTINDFNKSNELNQENNYKCMNCNKIFTRKFNLNRHLVNCNKLCNKLCNKSCNKLCKNDINNNCNHYNENINKELKNINHFNQTNTTTNNYNTIHNNYNKNLYLNFNVEPFDNDWDVSRISKFTRHSILLSKIMYSNLLDNILQNEKNLNVVIEKETNTGLVYKNNVDKFITMNIQDIIDKSMDKLNKHLKDFYKESLKDDEFVIMDKIFHEQLKNVENKYDDFKKNDEIKKKVEDFITQMYDKKKENAIKLYNNTLLKNDNDSTGY